MDTERRKTILQIDHKDILEEKTSQFCKLQEKKPKIKRIEYLNGSKVI